MRMKFFTQIILAACVATFGLTGCKPKPPGGSSKSNQPGGDSSIGLGPDGQRIGERPIVGPGGLTHGQFAAVLFDYDSARIKPSEMSKIETVAAYMKSNPGKLVVEGHCDERGTAEYNRALGERRALAAREELARLGVDGGRISTISYGNERPVEMGHDDTAWSRNRRCEFAVVNQ